MRTVGGTLAGIGLTIGTAGWWYAWNNTTYLRRGEHAARRAGFTEHRVTLPSGTTLNYAEGPDAGPALVLLHAQSSAWQNYVRVLPDLASRFHVFVPDIAGHGRSSRTPGRYNVKALGSDIVEFLRSVVGTPALVSGHYSGGLIAAWVAADAPNLVSAVHLEDPPFFSTDPDRFAQQFNCVDLARPAHQFLAQDTVTDFPSWYIEHCAWLDYFGNARPRIVRFAQARRRRHPDQPMNLWFFPPLANEAMAYLHRFDPRFADAFYTHAWQADFDQAQTLSWIVAPATLVHADWRVTDAGILEGAMTDDDAERARAALRDVVFERVHTGHGFHFEAPRDFVASIDRLRARVDAVRQ